MKSHRNIIILSTIIFLFSNAGASSPGSDNGIAHYTTEAGTMLAPTWDWAWHSAMREYTHASLRVEVRKFREMGFRRLYVVADMPGSPVFSSPATAPVMGGYKRKNLQNLNGDLNAAIAQACRAENMEVIAILKPYENGGSLSIPSGVSAREDVFAENTIGGTNLFFDSFASAHPDMRVARRNDYDADDYRLPITKIEVEFMLDAYLHHGAQGSSMSANLTSSFAERPNVHLLVSRDNAEYFPYKGKFSYRYKTERRTNYDANGNVLGENKRCNVLSITKINISEEYPYVAIMLENSFTMRTIPYSMIRWFSGDKELKLTAATYVRALRGGSAEWTLQDEPRQSNANYNINFTIGKNGAVVVKRKHNAPPPRRSDWKDVVSKFHKTGFFFSWFGVGHNGDGWKVTPLLGLARGKAPYMGGSLCEAYPEVRQYWIDIVKKLVDAGYTGVDIRLQCHSAMVMDYMNYGFNEPIAARYKELHGEDINTIPMTQDVYLRIMKIRGSYFMKFLEEAAKLSKARGARLLIHLRDAHENPTCNSDWNQLCHWTMPKISLDWRRCVELADEITIKDYYYKKYDPASAGEIKDYASSLGKRIWIHCYHGQGDGYDENFLRNIEKDKRISGILLYDVYDNTVDGRIGKETRALLEKLKYKEHINSHSNTSASPEIRPFE